MDSKALTQTLAKKLETDKNTVEKMTAAFAKILTEAAGASQTVSIPSFGSFSPVKYKEEIKPDLVTGKKMIFPPQIVVEFQPAVSFRKKVETDNQQNSESVHE